MTERMDSAKPRRHGRRVLPILLLAVATITAPTGGANPAPESARRFRFTYETRLDPSATGVGGPLEVFVPLARTSEHQRILSERIEASIPGTIETEGRYGNRFWHGSLPEAGREEIEIRVVTEVERSTGRAATTGPAPTITASDAALFLGPNERVAVGDEILDPILAEIRAQAGSDDPAVLARTAYDWVVDNVEYKKTGVGWGNGDTYWACSERYGNCTDFHALFISLARTLGIPARFEIGFPIPEDRDEGEIDGYHCWVEFHLPGRGWTAIDASEAFKDPAKRDFYYGGRPTDRIHLTTGRDLRLGDRHVSRPLNYFVYPHVEAAGKPFEGELEKQFSYRVEPVGAPLVR